NKQIAVDFQRNDYNKVKYVRTRSPPPSPPPPGFTVSTEVNQRQTTVRREPVFGYCCCGSYTT
ncbi:AAEL000927-PA, partial [Aedes aegypti]